MIQIFIIIGSAIYILLGLLHGFYTFLDVRRPRYLVPRDVGVLAAMRESSARLSAEINLWQAWLGFNFSHSLGLLMFGGVFLYIGVFYPVWFADSTVLQLCAVVISSAYVILSVKFWFSRPAIFTGAATVCFVLAAILSHLR